jgi:hypothetical protein
MLLVLIFLSISIILTAGFLNALENRTLDGNVYTTILNGENDILTFRNGSFQSNLSAGQGYDKGKYTTVTKGSSIWFKAKTVSLHEGELLWTGVVDGNAINGNYLHTKKGWFLFGDTTKQKNFKGSLKAE